MSDHTYLKEEEMVERAIHALMDALGPVETARFLTLLREKRLDSVARHQRWQKSLGQGEFFDQVFGPHATTAQPDAREP